MLLKELVFKIDLDAYVDITEEHGGEVYHGKIGEMPYRTIAQYEVVRITTNVRGVLEEAREEIVIFVKKV